MQITTIGIDLAKTVFQVHAVDLDGKAVVRKRLRRVEMLSFFTGLEPCLIGMEARRTLADAMDGQGLATGFVGRGSCDSQSPSHELLQALPAAVYTADTAGCITFYRAFWGHGLVWLRRAAGR